jgi:NAD-dependent dihydropyrimidine dehydrogenase PreA subunit
MKKKDSFDFLRKANLMESHKQFMRLCQESYLPIDMVEEEDDEQQPQDNMPTDDTSPAPEQGQDMPPQEDNTDMPPMDDNEPDMGEDLPPMDDNEDDLGDLPPLTDDEIGGEDEEVIDVEDITDAQEKLNKKGYYTAHCIDDDACIACAMCAMMCPDCAITVKGGKDNG